MPTAPTRLWPFGTPWLRPRPVARDRYSGLKKCARDSAVCLYSSSNKVNSLARRVLASLSGRWRVLERAWTAQNGIGQIQLFETMGPVRQPRGKLAR